ncbi:MAG TPA: hypothetical protein VFM82_03870, partial [Flavobacteriaceae bacterium]|nr:hypothetical protein [Flavobacteriaceae bacterium]
MKNHLIAVLIAVFCLVGCQDEKKKTANNGMETSESATSEKAENVDGTEHAVKKVEDSVKTLRGEFIYVDNAAVLKGSDFIYGVKIDSMAKRLAEKTDSLKRNEFDMVPVVIQGVVSKNPNDGWEEIVSIKKIVMVSKPV